MQSQRRRDDKTLSIATSLGAGLAVAAVGALALWVAHALVGLDDSTLGAVARGLMLVAGVAVVARLVSGDRSGPHR